MLRATRVQKALTMRNVILGADDGLITTFAIIAGSAGAGLSAKVVVVLGLAKLIADALSIAASVFLSIKSEEEVERGERVVVDSPIKGGLVTFASFVIGGFIPLFPYLLNLPNRFFLSSLILGSVLFILGAYKSINAEKSFLRGGLEMLLIGGGAAIVAYWVGFWVEGIVASGP